MLKPSRVPCNETHADAYKSNEMNRLVRRLHALLTRLVTFLCILVVAAWALSVFATVRYGLGQTHVAIASGELVLTLADVFLDRPSAHSDADRRPSLAGQGWLFAPHLDRFTSSAAYGLTLSRCEFGDFPEIVEPACHLGRRTRVDRSYFRLTTVSLPFWFLLAGPLVARYVLWRTGPRRFPAGHCGGCGYNLTGNVRGVCPECGMTTVDSTLACEELPSA